MHWAGVLAVAGGGAAGSVARFLISAWFKARGWTAFPWATLSVNVIGSFVLGVLVEVLLEREVPGRQQWFLLLGTGFCGGFTTFSTFAVECLVLLREDRADAALLYGVGSVLLGVLAAWLGFVIARALLP